METFHQKNLMKFIILYIMISETSLVTFRNCFQPAITLFLNRFGLKSFSVLKFRGKMFSSFLTDIPDLNLFKVLTMTDVWRVPDCQTLCHNDFPVRPLMMLKSLQERLMRKRFTITEWIQCSFMSTKFKLLELQWNVLNFFQELMLVLPHSNADHLERLFSIARKNKTNATLSLKLDGTFSPILAIKSKCPESIVPCHKFHVCYSMSVVPCYKFHA